ncbi:MULTISPECIES: restriction endonuclease [unclassified Bradyrhizobium]|uniref:restriction endonuclease n=1 Tax=unclassified Bradyrhizobium TaxID=2631580 RepID=UPI0028EBF7E6|nr:MULTISPECIES: restriction endonuclease [unclassified Bradyrhizobium]
MLGFGATGELAVGELPRRAIGSGINQATLTVSALIVPEQKLQEGILVRSTSAIWVEIASKLGADWSRAGELTPTQWEEMIAGAYDRAGYKVILTPRSGDGGRDIIATRAGFGCVKILGSVKAYAPGHLVTAEAVRSLIGVVTADQAASKGILTTTSDFAPKIPTDPSIAPFLPTRIQLMNGMELQKWLSELSAARPLQSSDG